MHDLEDQGRDVVAVERLLAGQELVDDGAERKQVGPAVDAQARGLFRRHVARRAEHGAGVGLLQVVRAVEAGDAEIGDLDGLDAAHQQDVVRLHVAMDDAAAVRMVERAGELNAERQNLLDRQFGVLGQDVAERLLVHELHRDVRRVAVAPDVEDGDDVGMGDRAGGACFAEEPADIFLVDAELFLQQLDGDGAVDVGVAGAIDPRHGAFADHIADFISADLAEARACRCQCHLQVSIVRFRPARRTSRDDIGFCPEMKAVSGHCDNHGQAVSSPLGAFIVEPLCGLAHEVNAPAADRRARQRAVEIGTGHAARVERTAAVVENQR